MVRCGLEKPQHPSTQDEERDQAQPAVLGRDRIAPKAQKEFREAHHPDAEEIFFWCAEDCGLAHGGVRVAPGSPIQDFRASWAAAVKRAHTANANVNGDLLFHDLRRSAVRCMIQDAGIPESQAMLISGHKTRTMLERYNIVSLKNVQDAGTKLDAWSRALATPAATSNPRRY